MSLSRFLPRKLGAKLVLLIVALGLTPMAVLGVVAYKSASSSLGDGAQTRVDDLAFATSDKLDRNLFERYGDVQAFAKSAAAQSMDASTITTWMDTMMGTYTPIYTLMVVADMDGKVIAANTVDLNGKKLASGGILGRDVSKEAWFATTSAGKLKDGETLVEDLHKDSLTGAVFGDAPEALAMSFTYPIRSSDGKIVGVWSNRFNWQVTHDILAAGIDRAKESGQETARLFVVSKAGTVLASDAPADTLARTLGEPEGDVLSGQFTSAGFSLYPGVGWNVVSTQERDEALSAAGLLRTTALVVGLIAALLLGFLAWLSARSITRPILALQRASDTAAGGDLTVRADESRTDELGSLATSFNAMVDSLAALVSRIHTVSDTIRTSAGVVAQSSGQAGSAAGEISDTVEGVARGAGEQAEATSVVTATMDEMSHGVRRVTEGVALVTSAAADADLAARTGAETVEAASEAMSRIEQSVGDAALVVSGMGEKSEEIGTIVEAITQISDQTNLLALNAAIEAARAGDQGRGFAVVADEVRKLAEESQRAAGSIAGLIGDIQRETSRAVDAMNAGRREVADGAERVQAAGSAFDDIRDRVAQLAGEVGQVSAAAEGLGEGAELVQNGIASVAAVSQENAASAEEVAASTAETASSVEQLSASAATLSRATDELSELVSRFRLAEEPALEEFEESALQA
jgi:methyl-accepting chemotaxis protein